MVYSRLQGESWSWIPYTIFIFISSASSRVLSTELASVFLDWVMPIKCEDTPPESMRGLSRMPVGLYWGREGSSSQFITKGYLANMGMNIHYINQVLIFLILVFLRFHFVTCDVLLRGKVVWAVRLCGAGILWFYFPRVFEVFVLSQFKKLLSDFPRIEQLFVVVVVVFSKAGCLQLYCEN